MTEVPVVAASDSPVALVDFMAPVREAMGSLLASRMNDIVRPLSKMIAEQLAPTMAAVAKAAQGLARMAFTGARTIARCVYEALLQFLEALPGGARFGRALRAFVDPILYPDFGRALRARVATRSPVPLSRATSPRHRLTRSSRSLRGPSASLVLRDSILGATLV